jgi:hypothetical protein
MPGLSGLKGLQLVLAGWLMLFCQATFRGRSNQVQLITFYSERLVVRRALPLAPYKGFDI